ncbi:hypothetical protein OG203_07855 [Nocardia sp. NBC_01499]|uniref:hypothetical protein n=1 Tax=Nocardia sp. NBC_01499 TaxID=2903597 RepID=UPI00386AAB31
MLHNIIRAILLALAVIVAVVVSTGPAAAVTPEQCEKEGGGKVHVVIDPHNSAKAVCTCEGGFYKDLEVFGPHVLIVGSTPLAIQCVGLDIPA